MNKVFLSGNLTRDPEVKYTQNGKAMTRMGIAVNRRFKNAENGQVEVDFFNLVAWEKTAEFCGRYLRKGSRVFVEGIIRTYNYTGQDGIKRSGIDIWVDNIEFGSSKREDTSTFRNETTQPAPTGNDGFEDDFSGDEISDDSVPF